MKRGGGETRWKSCWNCSFLRFLAMSVCTYMARPFDVFPFFEIFAWWKFTGNLFITAIPSLSIDTKFLSINSQEEFERRERGKPVFEEEFSRRNSFWKRLFNVQIVSRWDCFHLGFLLLFRRLVTFLFFFFVFLSPQKREWTSQIYLRVGENIGL